MEKNGGNSDAASSLFRLLPAIHEVLNSSAVIPLQQAYPREEVTQAARQVLAELRQRVQAGQLDANGLNAHLDSIPALLKAELEERSRPKLRRVLNATGVILQTNLGRAPLSSQAIAQIAEVAGGYCNLEFDLQTGQRSRRDVHAEDHLLELLRLRVPPPADSSRTPDRAAAVVNNCAAATFLALNTLAEGGEVIVSRGELVEIGGGFRIPDILAKSGAALREVGTTNKTRVSDYASAIGPATKLILRVHRSNFRIEGFTEQPALEQLVELGRRASVPVFDDQGTGCVLDLAAVGLRGESSWLRSVASGADLVAASGDKLLGGPQCGLLVGHREVVESLRSNPLFRALRVDKLTYAALEATLRAYNTGGENTLPVASMLHTPAEQIQVRCDRLAALFHSDGLEAEVIPTKSVVGGGTTPGASLASFAVAVKDTRQSEDALATSLRAQQTPVVSRVSEGRVLLDLRTISPADDDLLLAMLRSASSRTHKDAENA